MLLKMPLFRVGVTPDFYVDAKGRFEAVVEAKFAVPHIEWEAMPEMAGNVATPEILNRYDAVFAMSTKIDAASLAGVALAPQGEPVGAAAFAARSDADLVATASWQAPEGPDAAAFEQRYLAPAVHALSSGRLQRLSIVAARRCVSVEASDRYRLWRPRRAWLAALGAEG